MYLPPFLFILLFSNTYERWLRSIDSDHFRCMVAKGGGEHAALKPHHDLWLEFTYYYWYYIYFMVLLW